MNRIQVTGLNLESGREGGGVCDLWRRQWDARDLHRAGLGWGWGRRSEAAGEGSVPAQQAEYWAQLL